jgi:4-hydroxy-2-oxoheptanedioate aldolase
MAKRAAGRKGPGLGFWLQTANVAACEVAAKLGYDFALFDLEHGVFAAPEVDRMTALCKALGLSVHIRVAAAEAINVQQALDVGADVVVIPHIENLEHARAITAAAKYPPLGARSFGAGRTMGYGGVGPRFIAAENRRTLCLPMVETPGALADAAAIAALPTADGLLIGPWDLRLGQGGQYRGDARDLANIRAVAKAARQAGKFWAYPGGGKRETALARSLGAAWVAIADEWGALAGGLGSAIAAARR